MKQTIKDVNKNSLRISSNFQCEELIKNNARVLVFACTYPHAKTPYRAVFLHRRAIQLARYYNDLSVFTRHHITLGTYLSSWTRIKEHFREPSYFTYMWEELPIHGINIHLGLPLNYSLSAAKRTYKALLPKVSNLHKQKPFDIFHLATWGDFSLAAAWIAKKLGVPYIASAIGGYVNKYFDKPGTVPYETMREIFLGSEKVMCVSEDLRRKVDSVTDGRACTFVFYSGVDRSEFYSDTELGKRVRKQHNIKPNKTLILNVGRLGPEKGVRELLNVFHRLYLAGLNIELALIGPSKGSWTARQVKKHGLTNVVHLLGPQSPESMPGFFNAADVFAFPSWMEGLPNSVIEACACKSAVIATRVGGIPEIIDDGVSGLLVEPRNEEDLYLKLSTLITNVKLRNQLGKAAAKRVAELFDYNKNASAFAREFDDVLMRMS